MLNRYKFLKDLNLDQDVVNRLTNSLQRVVEGSNDIYRTPLAKDLSKEELLSLFESRFRDKINNLHPVLTNLENSNLSKFGPRSIMKPWNERKDSVLEYFDKGEVKARYSDLAGYRSIKTSDRAKLRPLTLDKASNLLKNNTSSGLPFLRQKGILKERVLANFEKLLSRKDPCVLFTRTQEGNKTRNVWGYPMADTLQEMRFYKPLLDYQRMLSWRAVLVGPEQVNNEITKLINSALINGNTLISIDFSAFDASIKYGLMEQSFDYIKSLYQNKYHNEINEILNRFSTIGIVTPDGVISGAHGVPSGSTFTNEVDSISQYLIAIHSGKVVENSFQIQGDDGVYSISEDSKESFLQNFRDFGLNVNIDKSYSSKDYVVYLQNLYHNEYRREGRICGIYPITRAFNRLIYQESWSDFEDFGLSGKDYYAIRSISILENCKYHPLFEDFVRFIVEIDKYKLQVSQKGLLNYVEMITSKSGTEGLFTNQYGDNVKGIKGFETFKVINRISK